LLWTLGKISSEELLDLFVDQLWQVTSPTSMMADVLNG
jgi:hypothetical protein